MPTITKTPTLNDLPDPPPGKVGWPWTIQNKLLPETMPDGSDWPKISIVTPSYNQGQFIEETIRSVLLQGYPNLEYIIIDGASTDSSVEIIKKYERWLAYWVSEKDNGQTHAINKGLTLSHGEILGWLNSDDMYVKGALRNIQKGFKEHPDCIVVHGNRILINEHSKVTGWSPLPSFNPKKQYTVASETAFWRRSIMKRVGFLKEELQFAMDLEYFCRLYKNGKFLKINNYLGYFRCYSSNKSSTIPHICLQESQQEWINLFGVDFPGKAVENKKKNHKTLLKDAIQNPFLILLPYVLYKIKKGATVFADRSS